jgi:hypothetical protein
MKLKFLTASLLYFMCSVSVYAADIVTDVPASPDDSGKYIFYLHGFVEEEEGPTEKYEAAVEAVAESSATVIAEVRGDTDPNAYAEKLKGQVNGLISKGVPASNITISGFSKGSVIALAAAGAIQNPDVNYVLLAGCSDFLNQKYGVDANKAVGRILAIYDVGDEKFGTCSGVISSDKVNLEEAELDSGKGHKLFRIPKDKFIEQWRDPLVDFAGA